MAKITRKTQKIFGGDYILDGAQTEIAVFGSKKDGAPAYSVDPDAIQSANYSQGWNDAVLTSLDGLKKMPLLQDSNALFYVLSRNLAYLNQAGIAEYDSNTVYYINDICRDVGTTNIYKSITDDNTGNVLTDSVNWESLGSLESLKQATTTSTGVSYLPKQITISSNFGTPASKIDFTAGNFNFYDGSGQGVMTAKTGDMVNLFGTSDGMLDVGAVTNDEVYHLFAVYNPTTGDSKPLASLSLTAPAMTLPNADGYTILGARIGSLLTDSSSQIIADSIISINSQNSNIPAFKATMSGDQTVATGVATKVQFSVRDFDTDNNYDSTTNYRFTPSVAGWYNVSANLGFADTGGVSFGCDLQIRKNGILNIISSSRNTDFDTEHLVLSGPIYCNGSSDYLEAWALISGSGSDTFEADYSNFQALRIF